MARKPTGRPNGRPKIEIDKGQFEKLCSLQCTLGEIAGFVGCNEDTVGKWCKRTYGECFSAVYKRYSQLGKVSLRRNQLKLSEHNASMAIWLGKQWLGQRDQDLARQDEADETAIDSILIQLRGRTLPKVDDSD